MSSALSVHKPLAKALLAVFSERFGRSTDRACIARVELIPNFLFPLALFFLLRPSLSAFASDSVGSRHVPFASVFRLYLGPSWPLGSGGYGGCRCRGSR